MHARLCLCTVAFVMVWCGLPAAHAVPRVPTSDTEIVESLPAVAGWSGEQRRLRRELVKSPKDERVALAAAKSYLNLARSQGDARYAGYAAGVLQAWQPMSAATPTEILVMDATVAQFLHDFEGAETTLKLALSKSPGDAQGWLTLATILRVRGHYAESDRACHALERIRQNLYALACLAENAGLRGDVTGARETLQGLLASPVVQDPRQASTRQWLLTTVAEVEELAGRPREADAAYRQALGAESSGYDAIAYSDFLLGENRNAEVLKLLATEPRSDGVLLRLAIAAVRPGSAQKLTDAQRAAGQKDREELAERFAAAALRPGAVAVHAREHAMFALDVQNDPKHALELARTNVTLQREPIDLLLFARAAVAAKDAGAQAEVKALMDKIGLRDARTAALL